MAAELITAGRVEVARGGAPPVFSLCLLDGPSTTRTWSCSMMLMLLMCCTPLPST